MHANQSQLLTVVFFPLVFAPIILWVYKTFLIFHYLLELKRNIFYCCEQECHALFYCNSFEERKNTFFFCDQKK